jgi:hypothetical protein
MRASAGGTQRKAIKNSANSPGTVRLTCPPTRYASGTIVAGGARVSRTRAGERLSGSKSLLRTLALTMKSWAIKLPVLYIVPTVYCHF